MEIREKLNGTTMCNYELIFEDLYDVSIAICDDKDVNISQQ